MDGYDPEWHDIVVFDDFNSSLPATVLLRLLDEYPVQYFIKGDFIEFCLKVIVIISNFPLSIWYDFKGSICIFYEVFECCIDCMWEYFYFEIVHDIR